MRKWRSGSRSTSRQRDPGSPARLVHRFQFLPSEPVPPAAALQHGRIVPPRVPRWRADCTHCNGPADCPLPDPPDRAACLPLPAAAQAMVCREGGGFLPSGRSGARHLPGWLLLDRAIRTGAFRQVRTVPVFSISRGNGVLRQQTAAATGQGRATIAFSRQIFALSGSPVPGALVPSGCGNLPGDLQRRNVSCSAFCAPAGQFQRQVKLQ